MAREDDFTVRTYLSDIKKDIGQLDEKWEATFEVQVSQREVLKQTSTTLANLTSVITMDTPERPSLISQVRELSKDLNHLKTSLEKTEKSVNQANENITKNYREFTDYKSGDKRTPKEVRVEQWKIFGSILALIVGAVIAYVSTT